MLSTILIHHKEIIGVITVLMTIPLFGVYLLDSLRGKITTHPFSWIVWTSINLIVFLAQVSDEAGPGAWMNGTVTLICLCIVFISLKNGFGNIKPLDIYVFVLCMAAIPVWVITDNAFYSLILVTSADFLACIPTFRKSWLKPYEEPVSFYALNAGRHGLSILAIAHYSLITTLAPVAIGLISTIMAVFLLWRRHVLKSLPAA